MLSPEGKANILVRMFGREIGTYENDLVISIAKSCAIICVDEIISSRPSQPISERHQETLSDQIEDCIDYWSKVKEYLTKM
jgi:hypothetical protein